MHATCNTAGNTDTNSSSNNRTRYINTKTNVGFLNAWSYTDPSRDVES